ATMPKVRLVNPGRRRSRHADERNCCANNLFRSVDSLHHESTDTFTCRRNGPILEADWVVSPPIICRFEEGPDLMQAATYAPIRENGLSDCLRRPVGNQGASSKWGQC